MKVSVLDLVPLREGQSYKEALEAMIRLAKKVESLGYHRYWIAEHHNTPSIASSATQLIIQHALANTKTIKVGSGGIMLPNHSPFIIAEQFGTLDVLYPNRVDLGLGRAPGTDMYTARAIRRNDDPDPHFPEDLEELQGYFEGINPVQAYPAPGRNVPIYILGSSTDSAYLAARLGLPYSFAAHFAPTLMEEAISIYRSKFRPSEYLDSPYVILGANAIVANSNVEAKKLSTTQIQSFLNIVTGQSKGLLPPVENEEEIWDNYIKTHKVPHFGPIAFQNKDIINQERRVVREMTRISFIGDKDTVKKQIEELRSRVEFDELIVNSYIYDEEAQHKSYELLAEVVKEINTGRKDEV